MNSGLMLGRYPAKITCWIPSDSRMCGIELLGLTPESKFLKAEIEYPLGDHHKRTIIELYRGDLVWVAFINGDPRYPIVTGYRLPELIAEEEDIRRLHHREVEIGAADRLEVKVVTPDLIPIHECDPEKVAEAAADIEETKAIKENSSAASDEAIEIQAKLRPLNIELTDLNLKLHPLDLRMTVLNIQISLLATDVRVNLGVPLDTSIPQLMELISQNESATGSSLIFAIDFKNKYYEINELQREIDALNVRIEPIETEINALETQLRDINQTAQAGDALDALSEVHDISNELNNSDEIIIDTTDFDDSSMAINNEIKDNEITEEQQAVLQDQKDAEYSLISDVLLKIDDMEIRVNDIGNAFLPESSNFIDINSYKNALSGAEVSSEAVNDIFSGIDLLTDYSNIDTDYNAESIATERADIDSLMFDLSYNFDTELLTAQGGDAEIIERHKELLTVHHENTLGLLTQLINKFTLLYEALIRIKDALHIINSNNINAINDAFLAENPDATLADAPPPREAIDTIILLEQKIMELEADLINIKANQIEIKGDTLFLDNIEVSGNVVVGGNVDIAGNLTAGGNLVVGGIATISGNVFASNFKRQ